MVVHIEQDFEQDRAAVLDTCRNAPQFVPVIHHGLLMAINHRSLDAIKAGSEISVGDYVVGLELLGYHLTVVQQDDGREFLCQAEPEAPAPEEWDRRALHLMAAFDRSRIGEAIDFIKERDGTMTAIDGGEGGE